MTEGYLQKHICFDFDKEIYGCQMTVHLHAFLRPEQKFDGLDLRDQIAKDVEHGKTDTEVDR